MLILIAEDVDDTRELMALLLDSQGHEIMLATNGQEAIEAVAGRRPDVILMDIAMPVMDGLLATKVLRGVLRTQDIPIFAVSAYMDDARWRDRAFAAGCNECLLKPVDFEGLLTLLQTLPTPPRGSGDQALSAA